MHWHELLSNKRHDSEIEINTLSENKYPRGDFERDYHRIISSASFRRLQDKTQVFPLDKSDFVRTRLTHSYEVSALAKTLGVMLQLALNKKVKNSDDKESIKNIPTILSCAGLLHDIGNPPFGHFGEEIIKNWFKSKFNDYSLSYNDSDFLLHKILSKTHRDDLFHFDGNAQALRVLTKLHFHDSDYGLNLTASVLNTLIKYPTASYEVKKKTDNGYSLLNKKMGYTQEDKDVFGFITECTGAKNRRHPLAFVLEAADDIAYKTADIEDGYKKGLFTLDDLLKYIHDNPEYKKTEIKSKYVRELFDQLNIYRKEATANKYSKQINNPDLYAIQKWVSYAREWLMYCAVYGFEHNYDDILNGNYINDLFYDTNHSDSIKIIDSVMDKFIYPNRNIVKLELAASSILGNLLDKFTCAVLFYDGKYTNTQHNEVQAYKKLYGLISDNYREAYKMSLNAFEKNHNNDEIFKYDIYLRLLLVIDYISGMTDSYARLLYQELNGIYGLSGIY